MNNALVYKRKWYIKQYVRKSKSAHRHISKYRLQMIFLNKQIMLISCKASYIAEF